MDQDTADVMAAKFVHCSADRAGVWFNDAAEHQAKAKLLSRLFTVNEDLGRSVEAGRKSD
jgi:hypothetical protein